MGRPRLKVAALRARRERLLKVQRRKRPSRSTCAGFAAAAASSHREVSILAGQVVVEVAAAVVALAVMTRMARSAAARTLRRVHLREPAAAVPANADQRASTRSV